MQFGDPNSHDANVAEFVNAQWHLKWLTRGVTVLGWHRIYHTSLPLPPHPEGVKGWIFNAETDYEVDRLQTSMGGYRVSHPENPLAAVVMGMQPHFPTGILDTLNAFLIPECFSQEDADKTVGNCVPWWQASDVHLGRINPCYLFKPGIRTDPTQELNEQEVTGAYGVSTFTGENTPPSSFDIISQFRNRTYV